MSYASKAGKAYASSRSPEAFGQCDRCSNWFLHRTLSFQFDYAGTTLQNKRLLVCSRCLDIPQPQLRAITLPADPVPIQNPRVPNFDYMETNYRYTSAPPETFSWTGIPIPNGDLRVTEDDVPRVVQQTGEPPMGLNEEPGTDPNAPGNDDPGLPLGNDEVPKTGPLS